MITLGDWAFPVDSFSFPPGSTLLCYTDGITESRDATGTFYDAAARLPVLLRRGAQAGTRVTPSQTLDALIGDVRRHAGGKRQDDQALLALHRPSA